MQGKGLYSPEFEHDACGIGFIANINGDRNRLVIDHSLEMLKRLDHRAGHNGDTGDGAGILTQIPDGHFRSVLPFSLPKEGHYGVGMMFIPDNLIPSIEKAIDEETTRLSLHLLGFRDVPVNTAVLKSRAIETCPLIRQVFVKKPEEINEETFDRKLYVLRRRLEKRFQTLEGFYIASLSARTIVYKGFLTPDQLGTFYVDLMSRAVI